MFKLVITSVEHTIHTGTEQECEMIREAMLKYDHAFDYKLQIREVVMNEVI